jgi:PAS domain S-box-containing protein
MINAGSGVVDTCRYGTAADLRAMADAIPALVSFFDARLVCQYANEHHCRWYGRTPRELVGLHLRDFLGEEGYAHRRPFLDRVCAGEEVSFDATVPHLDGSWHEAAIRYVPKIGDGGVEGFHILVFDTAVHHHRFRSVFEGRAIAFLELDLSLPTKALQSVPRLSEDAMAAALANDASLIRRMMELTPITAMNEKAASLFGLDRCDGIGTDLARLCTPATEAALTANLLAYISGETSFETETVMRRADGQVIDVLFTSTYPRRSERQDRVFLGIIDITARIRQNQKLARLEADLAHAARVATLGELTASIAHEVNQPLAAVIANGNAALRWLKRPEPDMAETCAAVERMIDESKRAAEIIARTRALATKGSTERSLFDPNQMIEDSAALVQRQVVLSGAELRLELAPGLPFICADRIQVQQVVINLMINAAQAMVGQQYGPRQIIVGSRAESGVIAIAVEDTGPGVAPDKVRHLFDAFYTTKETGMGMGLSVSKTIVEAHGGTIGFQIGASGGSIFTFALPVPDQAPLEA